VSTKYPLCRATSQDSRGIGLMVQFSSSSEAHGGGTPRPRSLRTEQLHGAAAEHTEVSSAATATRSGRHFGTGGSRPPALPRCGDPKAVAS
jgi:hypothetical protein